MTSKLNLQGEDLRLVATDGSYADVGRAAVMAGLAPELRALRDEAARRHATPTPDPDPTRVTPACACRRRFVRANWCAS